MLQTLKFINLDKMRPIGVDKVRESGDDETRYHDKDAKEDENSFNTSVNCKKKGKLFNGDADASGRSSTELTAESCVYANGALMKDENLAQNKSTLNMSTSYNKADCSPIHEDLAMYPKDYCYSIPLPELNSSPIKNSVCNHPQLKFASPPMKRKKMVLFSDNLVSDISNNSAPNSCEATPKKSILKSRPCGNLVDQKTILSKLDQNSFSDNTKKPCQPGFWQNGSIVQFPCLPLNLCEFISDCVNVLKTEGFDKRFEVYASINHAIRSSTREVILKLADSQLFNCEPVRSFNRKSRRHQQYNIISDLVALVRRDVTVMESEILSSKEDKENSPIQTNFDPFSIRAISQAIKLVSFIFTDLELNNLVLVDDARWFYLHSCSIVIRSDISKSLLIPYTILLKDYKFTGKKKKLIFDNPNDDIKINERILNSIIDMKYFPSASILIEKMHILRSLVANFPTMMTTTFSVWFSIFIINVCNLNLPPSSKIYDASIQTLFEISKCFNDKVSVLRSARELMSTRISSETATVFCERNNRFSCSTDTDSDKILLIEHIEKRIKTLVDLKFFKQAMDLWFGLTLLCAGAERGFDKWEYLEKWLNLHEYCFGSGFKDARLIASSSWKSVTYNIFHNKLENLKEMVESVPNSKASNEKPQAIRNLIEDNVHVLLRIFDYPIKDMLDTDIGNSMHNIFLGMLYNIMNFQRYKISSKYFHIYWGKIIEPVFENFYFVSETGSSNLNILGLGLLNHLMKGKDQVVSDKCFNAMRCLSSEKFELSDISPISPNWMFNRSNKVLHTIENLFKCKGIDSRDKVSCFILFLNNIKITTKKEMRPTTLTLKLIGNIAESVTLLLTYNKVDYSSIHLLLTHLTDAFDDLTLVLPVREDAESFFITLIKALLNDQQFNMMDQVLQLVYSSIKGKNRTIFLIDLIKLDDHDNQLRSLDFVAGTLEKRELDVHSSEEFELINSLLCKKNYEYELLIKKLIGELDLTATPELEDTIRRLQVAEWDSKAFAYFLDLLYFDSHLRSLEAMLATIKMRCESSFEKYFDVVDSLNQKRYDDVLFELREYLICKALSFEGFRQFEFCLLWKTYIKRATENNDLEVLDDLLVSSMKIKLNLVSLVRDKWESLPKFKVLWKSKYDQSPKLNFGKVMLDKETMAQHCNSVDIQNGVQDRSNGNLVSEDSQSQCQDAKCTETSIHLNIQKTASSILDTKDCTLDDPTEDTLQKRIKKESKINSAQIFDIHSFTAMLNAKLSNETPNDAKSKRTKPRKKNGRRKTKQTAQQSAEQNGNLMDEESHSTQNSSIPAIQDTGESSKNCSFEGPSAISSTEQDLSQSYFSSTEKDNISPNSCDDMDYFVQHKRPLHALNNQAKKRKIDFSDESTPEKDSKLKLEPMTRSLMEKFENSNPPINRIDDAEAVHSPIFSESESSSFSIMEYPDHDLGTHADEYHNSFPNSENDMKDSHSRSRGLPTNLQMNPEDKNTKHILNLIENTSDDELALLSGTEKYQMESALMAFMLRMRSFDSIDK